METKGIRVWQAKTTDLSGGASAGQFATTDTPAKTDGHIGKWIGNQIVDGVIPVADLVTTTGAAGTTQGLTAVGYGSWYGQVPRGAINGSNKVFLLDYKLVNPYAVLHLNRLGQLPAVQGNPSNPLTTMVVPNSEFSITDWTLTLATAPQPGESLYIYYFRADPLAAIDTITATVWTSRTSGDGLSHAFGVVVYTAPDGTQTNILSDPALWDLRENTASISFAPGSEIASFSGASLFFYLNGTLFANASNEFHIYDAYLNVSLADGSFFQLRPSSWGFTSGDDQNINSWKPSTAYASGVTILDGNGNLQFATVGGTSGASSPAWPNSGTTIDGSVTWTYQGPASSQTSTTGQITNPANAYDNETAPPSTFATLSRTHYSGLSAGGSLTLYFDGSAGAIPLSGSGSTSSGGGTGTSGATAPANVFMEAGGITTPISSDYTFFVEGYTSPYSVE